MGTEIYNRSKNKVYQREYQQLCIYQPQDREKAYCLEHTLGNPGNAQIKRV